LPDWHSSHGPANASELEDELAGFWRIRLDDYRIIYSIDDEVVTVEIVRVGQRTSRTYTGLPKPGRPASP
jgi:addiction module RelE/StbE family toxin